MTKVCLKEFPMGSYPKQKSDGYYITEAMKHGLDVLAKNITKDMQFVGVYTGDGTVRNGKSTAAQQHAYYYSWKVSQLTGKHIPFTVDNIVFRADKLMEQAHKLPRYSCIILDEGDDLTGHHFSKVMQTLNKFFRKCGQLNLFIILILPDFFELKPGYALTRSNYLCNVKFVDEFTRGYFDFFGPTNKRKLYLNGKRWKDYRAASPNYQGRFVPLYTVDEDAYRKAKLDDLNESDDDEVSTKVQLRNQKIKYFNMVHDYFPNILVKDLCKAFDISKGAATIYLKKKSENLKSEITENEESRNNYNDITMEKEKMSAQPALNKDNTIPQPLEVPLNV